MNAGAPLATSESDESIAEKIQRGQHQYFGEILIRYEAKIKRYARRFLTDPKDAEDAAQEAFIKAYRNIQSFDTSRKFSSWLYRIAHNECINFLRKRKTESLPLFDLDVLFPHLAREEHLDDMNVRQTKEEIELALGRLDPKYREPLILYYLEGFDYREIADILHIPVATVGVRLARGRKILKNFYEQLTGIK